MQNIKLFKAIHLKGNKTGLVFGNVLTNDEQLTVNQWIIDADIGDYVELIFDYDTDMLGDFDFHALSVCPNATESIKALCLLKWG